MNSWSEVGYANSWDDLASPQEANRQHEKERQR